MEVPFSDHPAWMQGLPGNTMFDPEYRKKYRSANMCEACGIPLFSPMNGEQIENGGDIESHSLNPGDLRMSLFGHQVVVAIVIRRHPLIISEPVQSLQSLQPLQSQPQSVASKSLNSRENLGLIEEMAEWQSHDNDEQSTNTEGLQSSKSLEKEKQSRKRSAQNSLDLQTPQKRTILNVESVPPPNTRMSLSSIRVSSPQSSHESEPLEVVRLKSICRDGWVQTAVLRHYSQNSLTDLDPTQRETELVRAACCVVRLWDFENPREVDIDMETNSSYT